MPRPKYKKMYLEQLDRANGLSERLVQATVALESERKAALGISKDRASIRYNYVTLHQKAEAFIGRVHHDVLTGAVEKEGWLYIPALDPETTCSFTTWVSKFRKYVEDNRPPIL
jgi:hypothetical protein